MAWTVDARVPVTFGDLTILVADDAILVEESASAPTGGPVERFTPATAAHAAACDCCAGRSPAALALDRLFQRRARGEVAFFRRVVVIAATPEAELEVWSALRGDPLASARFRFSDANQAGVS